MQNGQNLNADFEDQPRSEENGKSLRADDTLNDPTLENASVDEADHTIPQDLPIAERNEKESAFSGDVAAPYAKRQFPWQPRF